MFYCDKRRLRSLGVRVCANRRESIKPFVCACQVFALLIISLCNNSYDNTKVFSLYSVQVQFRHSIRFNTNVINKQLRSSRYITIICLFESYALLNQSTICDEILHICSFRLGDGSWLGSGIVRQTAPTQMARHVFHMIYGTNGTLYPLERARARLVL